MPIIDLLPYSEIKKVTFHERPRIAPAELRYFRKISLLVMILKLVSKNEQSSILRLHFFNWSLASEHNRGFSLRYIQTPNVVRSNIISLDPALNRAIEFAIAERFVELTSNGRLRLSPRGTMFFTKIMTDDELLKPEKDYLLKVQDLKTGESKMRAIMEGVY